MYRTLVISETRPEADEASPPQYDIGHPSPVVSPRASSPKRARTDQGKEPSLMTDSSATPRMDDVSTSLAIFLLSNLSNFFCCRNSSTSLFLCRAIFQPSMKEFVRLGTQFI